MADAQIEIEAATASAATGTKLKGEVGPELTR